MRVTVPCFAKLNLDLRVLYKRPDQFHELRTIFQTISLKDMLGIEFQPGRRSSVKTDSSIDIADNLVGRAAELVMAGLKIRAAVHFQLTKTIPMGAGLGGGSSNAAAVLMALPALAGKKPKPGQLAGWAEQLGSDVPFFLFGGTAMALGRGTELYPLPDLPSHSALVVSTGVHVSTARAYQALQRTVPPDVTNALTSPALSPILREFQTNSWALETLALGPLPLKNDFEDAVFPMHPELAAVVRKLRKAGAKPALMTGSGSALFGVFQSTAQARTAAEAFPECRTFVARFVSRRQYRRYWSRALAFRSNVR